MNNMLGEYDLNPPGRRARPGARLTSMMAPSIVLDDGGPRLVVGSAGSLRLRGAILQIVVNVVHHGMPVEEAIDGAAHPRRDGHVHCEGGSDPAELDRARGARLRARPLATAEPLFRRRLGGRAPCRRLARGRGRPAARRAWHRRARMSDWLIVRPAVPGGRRRARRARPRASRREPELWLTYDRTRGDERRNVRGVRADANVAVLVAETADGIVGRLSIARDRSPLSRHVAEFGLMVAARARRQGIGSALIEEAMKWARGLGVRQARAERLPAQRARDRALPQARVPARRGFCAGGTSSTAATSTRC